MHTNEPREAPSADMGYETRDIALKPIIKITIGFFIFAIASTMFGWVFLAGLSCGPVHFEGYSKQYSKTFVESKRVMPDEKFPLLQGNLATRADIQQLRQAEDVRLNGYGLSADKTKATIPVSEAMKVIAAGDAIATGNEVPAVSKGNTTSQKKEPAPGDVKLDQAASSAHTTGPAPKK